MFGKKHEDEAAHEGEDRKDGGAVPDDRTFAIVDGALRVQRPAAAKYVASLRAKNPDASDDQLVERIEKHFVQLLTATGAGVGGAAVLPGVGTAAALALTAGEGAAFAEACAFLTLSVAEIRGVDMGDKDRRRAVTLGVLGGEKGADIMAKALGKQGAQWSGVLSGVAPDFVVRAATSQFKRMIKRRLATRVGSVWAGRLIPFGIGAIVGGIGNRSIARSVVEAEREIFAQAPGGGIGSGRPSLEKGSTDGKGTDGKNSDGKSTDTSKG